MRITAAAIVLAAACGHLGPALAEELLPPDRPIQEVVDHYIDAGLAAIGTAAAEQASEPELVRRLMLDLAGRIPSSAEVREYLDSPDRDKRTRLVDRLLASPEFAEHLAVDLDVAITGRDGSIRGYLEAALKENRRWDRVLRDVVLPDPDDPLAAQAGEFLKRRARDADRLANEVSVAFFGVNVSCAQCHDHPLVDDWTQDHFYGMKAFFNRTFEAGGFVAERGYGAVRYTTTGGEERLARPMFLTGLVLDEPDAPEPSADERKREEEQLKKLAQEKKPPPAPAFSRREQLVRIALEDDQQRYFAKAIVNRLWYQLFGYGLVMPLDQMHSENPPSHPELLDWLARDLVAHQYDVQRVVRGMALSAAYSRSSRWQGERRPWPQLFAVAQVRPLTPDQLARSLSLASADPRQFDGEMTAEQRQQRSAAAAGKQNADRFQYPNDNFQISAAEALLMSNSERVEQAYLRGGLVKHLVTIEDPRALVETAVWSILSRPPDEEEMQILVEYLAQRQDRAEDACRQLVWALLASAEFRFNH